MPVNTPLKEYKEQLPNWQLVDDVLFNNIRQPIYVPDIDPNSPARCKEYRRNGVTNNFTKRTVDALIGSLYRYDPTITLPGQLDYLYENCDGNNLSLVQFSKDSSRDLLAKGRIGVFVDFPQLDRNPTRAELKQGNISAKLINIRAENLIKWRVQSINGNLTTTLLVFKESKVIEDNLFDWTTEPEYRACALIDGIYQQALFNQMGEQVTEWFASTDSDGNYWNRIPFHPGGAVNNDLTIDASPILDLAELNIAYYRNSCAHEDYIKFLNGGLTVIRSDMNQDQFQQKNPGKKLYWGSRSVYMLGTQDSIDLIQGKDTDCSLIAMQNKIEMAVGLGAKLIVSGSGIETATAAEIRNASENSVLMSVANNSGDMITHAIQDCARFMIRGYNVERDTIDYELSKKFYESPINPQMLVAQIQLLDRNVFSLPIIRDNLRKHDLIPQDMTDEEIDNQILATQDLVGFDTNINTNNNG